MTGVEHNARSTKGEAVLSPCAPLVSIDSVEPRAICARCRRPSNVCYCAHVVPLRTRTRVVILQHPRERDVGINTARIAKLCLPDADVSTGVDFTGDACLERALAEGAWLLYPGAGARRSEQLSASERPRVLITVDGTWWQARSILKHNPRLADLPRLSLETAGESRYVIRAEPAPHCMATIEALSRALGELEDDAEKFTSMMAPFDAMVASQVRFAREVKASRQHRNQPARRQRFIPPWILERAEDLVVVHLEANAWPREPGAPSDEIVQWVAVRPASGERFEAVVRPSGALAPATPDHIQVPASEIRDGEGFDAFLERWRRFSRPADVAVTWGGYTLEIARTSGVPIASDAHDLRPVVRDYLNERPGTLERAIGVLGLDGHDSIGRGRGGRRAAAIARIIRHLADADPFTRARADIPRKSRRNRRPF